MNTDYVLYSDNEEALEGFFENLGEAVDLSGADIERDEQYKEKTAIRIMDHENTIPFFELIDFIDESLPTTVGFVYRITNIDEEKVENSDESREFFTEEYCARLNLTPEDLSELGIDSGDSGVYDIVYYDKSYDGDILMLEGDSDSYEFLPRELSEMEKLSKKLEANREKFSVEAEILICKYEEGSAYEISDDDDDD